MRIVAAALSVWLLVACIAASFHEATVQHVRCEHGAVVHARWTGEGASNGLLPGTSVEHLHDCLLDLLEQTQALGDSPASSNAIHTADCLSTPRAPEFAPQPLLSIAPSRSPPA